MTAIIKKDNSRVAFALIVAIVGVVLLITFVISGTHRKPKLAPDRAPILIAAPDNDHGSQDTTDNSISSELTNSENPATKLGLIGLLLKLKLNRSRLNEQNRFIGSEQKANGDEIGDASLEADKLAPSESDDGWPRNWMANADAANTDVEQVKDTSPKLTVSLEESADSSNDSNLDVDEFEENATPTGNEKVESQRQTFALETKQRIASMLQKLRFMNALLASHSRPFRKRRDLNAITGSDKDIMYMQRKRALGYNRRRRQGQSKRALPTGSVRV